jgi:hypothetical protein
MAKTAYALFRSSKSKLSNRFCLSSKTVIHNVFLLNPLSCKGDYGAGSSPVPTQEDECFVW